ncbi:MAG: ABC transporter ATP-binding protein [Psychroflexus sp.]|nr:ABC transporter ATP-binding protein [Psychroflexus sp.]MDR9448124.1 ABC transporter ATP-binding protein [Psychroflexus sp.]
MIKAQSIYKSYGKQEILKSIDLHIKKKEIVSIVGPSGAGKTTLLQIIGTLEKPDNHKQTKLEIDGQSMAGLTNKKMAKFRNQHIGFVFQFHQLLPEFTALENTILPAMIYKDHQKEAKSRAVDILKDLGLENRLNNKPNELSGGEQQRVAVARALINKPSVLLADEPSGNLDSASADQLHQLFLDLRDKYGQTFVIVTHNKALADLADRKLSMIDGEIING